VVETHIGQGDPRIVLRDLAATADLLVIGARGHRGVSYLLLGSTTTSLLHHPLSPTVVVPFVE
jgi:nucleotide-binding universal stress UspA family protein